MQGHQRQGELQTGTYVIRPSCKASPEVKNTKETRQYPANWTTNAPVTRRKKKHQIEQSASPVAGKTLPSVSVPRYRGVETPGKVA